MNQQIQTSLEDYTRVNLHVHDMLKRGQITDETCSFLTTYIDRTQQSFILPKIHNSTLKFLADLLCQVQWAPL